MAEVDIAAVFQLLGAVATEQRQSREDVRALTGTVNALAESFNAFRVEMHDALADKADKADVASLRQALTEYHSSVVGHGMLISDLEDRVRRIERHLGLPPVAAE